MEKTSLIAESREDLSKGYTKELRRKSKIPAVMYGHSKPVSLAVDEHEFNSKFRTISENIIIKLILDKKNYDVLVKDYQEDILTGKITHLDFYEIEKGKLLKTRVPVHTEGTPAGIKLGGLFELFLHEIEVECLPKDMPETITLDVSELDVGHSIHIRDIAPQEGVKVLNPPDQVVCIVIRKREEVEAAPAEEEGVAEAEEAAEGKEQEE